MTAAHPIPRTLYKYVSDLNAVKSILSGQIKFASFYELNDATEAATVGDDQAIQKDLWEIQHSGLTDAQFKKLMIINKYLTEANLADKFPFNAIDGANDYIRQSETKNVKKILVNLSNNLKGILDPDETHSLHYLCLSERYDSLPMWAHYAKRGTGFVVVFSNLEQLFPSPEPWEFDGLHRVRYQKPRPPITFDPFTLENLFLTKTIDWQYEQEVRVVKPAEDLEKFTATENPRFPMKYLKFDAKFVSGVICGYQYNFDEFKEIRTDLTLTSKELYVSRSKIFVPRAELIVSRAVLQNDGQIHLNTDGHSE
ncbi:MAG: DUF2971 domain-containing protein [Candidatus Pacebacteria bacterium]|nr:DUF2971 domain-containing protein [Candidatus Paceibacterota bacterium]